MPNYRIEVPVYMVVPALMSRMGMDMLGTYHDRVGEDRPGGPHGKTGDCDVMTPDFGKRDVLAWARAFGELGHVSFDKGAGNFSSQGPSYDFDIEGITLGLDILRSTRGGGTRDIAGLYVGYMHGHADVDQVYSSSRAGKVDMDGYSLGGYYTMKGASGWYLDAVGQATWYTNVTAKSEQHQKIHPNGQGLTASLEGGYPLTLGNGYSIEPQAQMIYQWNRIDSCSDDFGYTEYDAVNSWMGRIGSRLNKDWRTESDKKGTVWARANLWHQFGSDARTTFTNNNRQYPVSMQTNLGDTWLQVGLGVSGQLTKNLSAFATGDFNQGLGKSHGYSFTGRVGLRCEF